MSKYRVRMNGSEYEIEIERIDAPETPRRRPDAVAPRPAAAPAKPQPVQAPAPSRPAPAPAAETGGRRVESPMPGTVIRLNAAVGDVVEKGAPILILEAMKMENEIFAPQSGTLTHIAAQVGQTVATGDYLFEIT